MSCNSTHELRIITKGSQVTREWIDLTTGLVETNAATITALEDTLDGSNCASCPDKNARIQKVTGVTPFSISTSKVYSLTLTVTSGAVDVEESAGVMEVPAKLSLSWGCTCSCEPTLNNDLIFTGTTPETVYFVHWEE